MQNRLPIFSVVHVFAVYDFLRWSMFLLFMIYFRETGDWIGATCQVPNPDKAEYGYGESISFLPSVCCLFGDWSMNVMVSWHKNAVKGELGFCIVKIKLRQPYYGFVWQS